VQKTKSQRAILQFATAEITSRASLILKASAVTMIVVILYFQDLAIVFNNALHDESTFHTLAIPFLFAYLLYRKRKMISATCSQEESNEPILTKHFSTIVGILLCAIAVIAYWYGSYTFTPLEYHMLTLPVFAAGLTLILFNTRVLRQLAFPITFLVFLTPPPVEIFYGFGSTLSIVSAQAANTLVNAFRMSSSISSQYGNPIIALMRPDHTVMNFTVDVACSGIYSLIGFVIFAVFVAFIARGKLRNKAAIMLMGIPLIVALNIMRITTILTIGFYYGDQPALQVFHLLGATVLMFLGTLLLLAITEKAFKKPVFQQPCPICTQKPPSLIEDSCPNCGKIFKVASIKLWKGDLAKIASVAIVVAILLSIQAPVFALTAGPAQVMIQTLSGEHGNTQILPQIPGYDLNCIYRDTTFEQLAGEDASLVYTYTPTDTSKATVWVAVEVAQSQWSLHRWEDCLIAWPISQGDQSRVTQLDLRDTRIQANPPIVARYFAFQYHSTNQTQLVLYWYEKSTFATNNTFQQEYVKMSLIIYPKTTQDVAKDENQLLPFAIAINNYWQPIIPWAPIALAISQNGFALSAATVALLVAILFYQAFLNMQETLSLLKFYDKLSEQDRQLIAAVRQARKIGKPTISTIAQQIYALTKTSFQTDQLVAKLEEAAHAGLLRKIIISNADEPTVTWTSLVPQKTYNILNRNKE
jgi:exosortase